MEINPIEIAKFNIITKIEVLSDISLPTKESIVNIKNLPFDYDKLVSFYSESSNSKEINFSKINVDSIDSFARAFIIMLGYSDTHENLLLKLVNSDYSNFLTDQIAATMATELKHLKLYNPFIKFLDNFDYKDSITNFLNRLKNSLYYRNQILVLIAPSNILWIKSEEPAINKIPYDCKINNYNYIYFNDDFIKNDDCFKRIYLHPRCEVGFISSMVKDNIEKCLNQLQTKYKYLEKGSIDHIINQSHHDTIKQEINDDDKSTNSKNNTKVIPTFKRNINKIINKFSKYNITNIIILESEKDKIYDEENEKTTKYNSIDLNIFNKDDFLRNSDQKISIRNETDQNIEYILDILNNCDGDVREYMFKHPRNIKKSEKIKSD